MRIFFTFLALILTSCTTSSDVGSNGSNIDIVDSPKNKQRPVRLADPNRPIVPEAVFNWQKFFKGPPASKDRPALLAAVGRLKSSSSIDDLIKKGRNQFSLGLISDAEATFREALRQDNKNVDLLIDLATTLQRQRKISGALTVLSEARERLSQSESPQEGQIFRYRYILALTYLANDDRAKAHSILSDLVGKDRTFLPGYATLAFSYLKDGKDSVAKFIVEQAIDRGGDHPSLYNILGLLAEREGDKAKARLQYNKALTLNDSYAPALVNRGNIYLSEQETSMAESDYRRALDADPSSTDALIGLAAVYRQTGRFAAAKEKLQRAIDLDGDNPNARFNLAILMRENLKDEGLALRYYGEVLQSDRANPNLKSLAKAAIEEIRSL